MANELVSIVVPVYNVQEFLPECLESLISQTYKNIEVIFVNDGSTDGSQQLLEKVCSQHSNFKLINQANKGVSAARIAGLEAANGEFLYWLDPDDMIHPRTIEIFVNLINKENADFVCGWGKKCHENIRFELSNWKKIKKINFDVIDEANLIKFICGVNIGSNWSLQVKLYRVSTLKQIPQYPNIIPTDYSRGEDLRFNSNVINYSKKAVLVNHIFHMWRQRRSSLTHAKTFNRNDLKVLESFDPYLTFKERTEEQKMAILGNKAYQASLLLCCMKKCKHSILYDVEKAYKIYEENKKYCRCRKYHRFIVRIAPLHKLYWIWFVKKTKRINKF